MTDGWNPLLMSNKRTARIRKIEPRESLTAFVFAATRDD
jgi:hypothetical protein